jgi:3-oxoacyl-[acyl-carrier-protein] synthase-3
VETRNRLRALNTRILDRNGLHQTDIAGYLTQNLSFSAFRGYGESLGVPIAKPCFDNLAQHGHLGPNDVFFNLSAALDRGHLTLGDRAILLNISPSATWSALLIETATTAYQFWAGKRVTRGGEGIRVTLYADGNFRRNTFGSR